MRVAGQGNAHLRHGGHRIGVLPRVYGFRRPVKEDIGQVYPGEQSAGADGVLRRGAAAARPRQGGGGVAAGRACRALTFHQGLARKNDLKTHGGGSVNLERNLGRRVVRETGPAGVLGAVVVIGGVDREYLGRGQAGLGDQVERYLPGSVVQGRAVEVYIIDVRGHDIDRGPDREVFIDVHIAVDQVHGGVKARAGRLGIRRGQGLFPSGRVIARAGVGLLAGHQQLQAHGFRGPHGKGRGLGLRVQARRGVGGDGQVMSRGGAHIHQDQVGITRSGIYGRGGHGQRIGVRGRVDGYIRGFAGHQIEVVVDNAHLHGEICAGRLHRRLAAAPGSGDLAESLSRSRRHDQKQAARHAGHHMDGSSEVESAGHGRRARGDGLGPEDGITGPDRRHGESPGAGYDLGGGHDQGLRVVDGNKADFLGGGGRKVPGVVGDVHGNGEGEARLLAYIAAGTAVSDGPTDAVLNGDHRPQPGGHVRVEQEAAAHGGPERIAGRVVIGDGYRPGAGRPQGDIAHGGAAVHHSEVSERGVERIVGGHADSLVQGGVWNPVIAGVRRVNFGVKVNAGRLRGDRAGHAVRRNDFAGHQVLRRQQHYQAGGRARADGYAGIGAGGKLRRRVVEIDGVYHQIGGRGAGNETGYVRHAVVQQLRRRLHGVNIVREQLHAASVVSEVAENIDRPDGYSVGSTRYQRSGRAGLAFPLALGHGLVRHQQKQFFGGGGVHDHAADRIGAELRADPAETRHPHGKTGRLVAGHRDDGEISGSVHEAALVGGRVHAAQLYIGVIEEIYLDIGRVGGHGHERRGSFHHVIVLVHQVNRHLRGVAGRQRGGGAGFAAGRGVGAVRRQAGPQPLAGRNDKVQLDRAVPPHRHRFGREIYGSSAAQQQGLALHFYRLSAGHHRVEAYGGAAAHQGIGRRVGIVRVSRNGGEDLEIGREVGIVEFIHAVNPGLEGGSGQERGDGPRLAVRLRVELALHAVFAREQRKQAVRGIRDYRHIGRRVAHIAGDKALTGGQDVPARVAGGNESPGNSSGTGEIHIAVRREIIVVRVGIGHIDVSVGGNHQVPVHVGDLQQERHARTGGLGARRAGAAFHAGLGAAGGRQLAGAVQVGDDLHAVRSGRGHAYVL